MGIEEMIGLGKAGLLLVRRPTTAQLLVYWDISPLGKIKMPQGVSCGIGGWVDII
jgi:hypothetical protein